MFALKLYHREDHILHEYLHHSVAARNTRGSAALFKLALVIPRCRTNNTVSRFCLLLFICGTCYRQMRSVESPRVLIRVL